MTCDVCAGTGTVRFGNWPREYDCHRCFGTGTAVLGVSYAGIGSRETPDAILKEMENVAFNLALRGFVLRSGGAKPKTTVEGGKLVLRKPGTGSADLAFEKGADMVKGRKLIRVATAMPRMLEDAAKYHPNWDACDDHAKRLHARNSQIVKGDYFDDLARFVVCWTEGGKVVGGTGQGLRIAAAHSIPVFNFGAGHTADQLWSWLDNA